MYIHTSQTLDMSQSVTREAVTREAGLKSPALSGKKKTTTVNVITKLTVCKKKCNGLAVPK